MTASETSSSEDISRVLNLGDKPSHHKRILRWLIVIVVLAMIALGIYFFGAAKDSTVQYKMATVQQGELLVTVTATGTLEPVNQVEVGTETSGTVKSVAVDFNDIVKVGQILATLDTEQLQAKLRQSLAALDTSRASVTEAEATLVESRNKLNRSLELQKRGLCSQEDCDAAQAAFDRARATLSRAQAQVTQAQAQVDAERTILSKAEIRSPINGIVLKRQIEPGQTVAASFQTPVLFVLAENLAQMELKVAVDEADVGKVHEGQNAMFTVDAYPEREYPATITQVRFAPETVEGVVTYETVLSVDNSDLSLRPGMTATANINVERHENAILVPNTALRFTPPATQQVSDTGGSLISQLLPRPPRRTTNNRQVSVSNARERRVWILQNDEPVAVPIKTGATNGVVTQVLGGDVQPGLEVIIDSQSRAR